MDKAYADTVRLLLQAAPDVFANDIFAMKGGTAINLFVRDMPRLSVDIDIVFKPWQVKREEALKAISSEIENIAQRLRKHGLETKKIASTEMGDTKLLIRDQTAQVKIEVNTIFRGSVMQIEHRPLSPKTAEMFSAELKIPTLAPEELYGSKLVAAMDRQHPRDLFDVLQLYETEGLSESIVECFVTYLAGHDRPTHEVLFGNDKNIASEYENNFVGMTTEPVKLDTLLATRTRLRSEITQRLTAQQKEFLTGLSYARPNWNLLQCPHASDLPALRWKIMNLEKFQKQRPADFEYQAKILADKLG